MPEVKVTIGGRDFEVACQDGEEHFLRTAAKMLDGEATVLVNQIGRLPEARMLLMAGLMLADKTAGLEDQLTPLKYSEYLKNNISNSKLETIADAGHMVMLEKPEEFNEKLGNFVKGLDKQECN